MRLLLRLVAPCLGALATSYRKFLWETYRKFLYLARSAPGPP